MSMTSLEKILAIQLAKVSNVDIPAIIAYAQECCMGGCDGLPGAASDVTIVVTPTEVEKSKRVKASVKEVKPVEPIKPVETPAMTAQPTPEPVVEKPAPVAPAVTTPGVDITGLFTGTGADKKVVKEVFLAAVENAKTLAPLIALNATCDCGFATGDYTEETAAVLKRKLARWGAAQE